MTTPDMLSGRYRLGRVLGRGGMGSVYEAHDMTLSRDVAVKMLHVDQASPESIERFRREARILAGLSHPNIVTVYDFAVDGDSAWLVMRLLPGPTLQTLLKKRGRLPIDAAERYAREAASALAAAHAAGIVHRDIKPGNLMLGAEGSCTLVDLGIARLAGSAEADTGLTQPGMMLGTVHYLAPEVITGGAPTPASDVYALGGVLFLMLTGRTPFAGSDTVSALGQHVHAPVPSLRQLRPDIPPGLEQLCQRMLSKDPQSRPTAAQIASILGGSAARGTMGEPNAATVSTSSAAAATQAIRPGPSTTAAPIPPVSAADGSAGRNGLGEPSSSEQKHASRAWVVVASVAVAAIVGAIAWLLLSGHNKSATSAATTPAPSPSTSTSSRPSPSVTPSSPSVSDTSSSQPPSPTPTTPTTTAADTPSPSDTVPSTNQSDSSSALQPTLMQETIDIRSALNQAIVDGSLSALQKARLDHAYTQLSNAIDAGDDDLAGKRLTTLGTTVDDLHDNGAITDSDYGSINDALGTMRTTLDGS